MIKDHADREPGDPQQRCADREARAHRAAGEHFGEAAVPRLVGDEPAADDAADPRAKAERLPIAPPAGRQLSPCRPIATGIAGERESSEAERGQRAGPAGEGSAAIVERGLIIRSEEHTSELQSLMRISYAVFCLKKKTRRY